jgi:hypothetical protein
MFKSNQRPLWKEIVGNPEGHSIGSPGDLRYSTDTDTLWIKAFGRQNTTGWREVTLDGETIGSSVGANLTTDFSTTVTAPTYTTLFSLALQSTQASSFLAFAFTCTWRHTGNFAGNVEFNCRFRLNGALITGGCSDNKVRLELGTVARIARLPITQGLQTLNVEVTKFGGDGNTVEINPATTPDEYHASLYMQEVS